MVTTRVILYPIYNVTFRFILNAHNHLPTIVMKLKEYQNDLRENLTAVSKFRAWIYRENECISHRSPKIQNLLVGILVIGAILSMTSCKDQTPLVDYAVISGSIANAETQEMTLRGQRYNRFSKEIKRIWCCY